jgi:hypothetical protein
MMVAKFHGEDAASRVKVSNLERLFNAALEDGAIGRAKD